MADRRAVSNVSGSKREITSSDVLFQEQVGFYKVQERPGFNSQITANQDNYSLNSFTYLNIDSDANGRKITGLSGGENGYITRIRNNGSFYIEFTHQDIASSSANRLILPFSRSFYLPAGEEIWLRYSVESSRWLFVQASCQETIIPLDINKWGWTGAGTNTDNLETTIRHYFGQHAGSGANQVSTFEKSLILPGDFLLFHPVNAGNVETRRSGTADSFVVIFYNSGTVANSNTATIDPSTNPSSSIIATANITWESKTFNLTGTYAAYDACHIILQSQVDNTVQNQFRHFFLKYIRKT